MLTFLLISIAGNAATISVPDKLTDHDCVIIDNYFVCDMAGMKQIDLGLNERDECFDELKKKGDSSLGKTIFWLGIGIVTGIAISN